MKKYNAVELLRLYFMILIIIGHTIMGAVVGHAIGNTVLHPMGSFVNIFFLISGFFLYRSLDAHTELSFGARLWRRCLRLLPALILYKVLCTLIFGISAGGDFQNLLSNIFMLNKNIGINIPTMTHVIWYVDVLFWGCVFYMGLFELFPRHRRSGALLITGVIMILSLCMLFGANDVNMHFQMANAVFDGGMLRGMAFMGMGILLAALPVKDLNSNHRPVQIVATMAEVASLVAVVGFPLLFTVATKTLVLNYVLWAVVFMYLMTREYGWLSRWLNSRAAIGRVSRYCYEVYVFQFFAIKMGEKWLSPHSHPYWTILGTIIFAFIIGIAVKEIFEDRIVKKYLG